MAREISLTWDGLPTEAAQPAEWVQRNGLHLLYQASVAGARDLAKNIQPAFGAGVSFGPTQWGAGLRFSGSQSGTDAWFGAAPFAGATRVYAHAVFRADALAGDIIAAWSGGGASQILPIRLGSSGEIIVAVIDGISSSVLAWITQTGVCRAGAVHSVYVAAVSGATPVVWVDGIAYATSRFVGGTNSWSVVNVASSLKLGVDAAGSQLTGAIGQALIETDGWSLPYAQALSANPASLWDEESIWVPVSVSGGTVTIDCTPGNATAAGVQATISSNVTILCSVGNANAAGVQAAISVNTRIDCAPGSAAAAGTPASIAVNQRIDCSPGSATAAGVSCTVTNSNNVTISCTPGAGIAAGVPCTVGTNVTIPCVPGSASAAGIPCTVTNTVDVTINCTPGQATAAGVLCGIATNVGIVCSPGAGTAAGVPCAVTSVPGVVTIECRPGQAVAAGVTCSVIATGAFSAASRLRIGRTPVEAQPRRVGQRTAKALSGRIG